MNDKHRKSASRDFGLAVIQSRATNLDRLEIVRKRATYFDGFSKFLSTMGCSVPLDFFR